MQNTIQGEGFELFSSQDLGEGGGILHYPGCGFMGWAIGKWPREGN